MGTLVFSGVRLFNQSASFSGTFGRLHEPPAHLEHLSSLAQVDELRQREDLGPTSCSFPDCMKDSVLKGDLTQTPGYEAF